jgi:NAD(P)-dependent dehydrogenase (short-subunit alcohol dehydrogenase family)
MGLAVAKDLLSKGWNVCVCDLNPPKAEDLELGDNVIYQKADVTDYESLGSVFLATWAKWKRLDFGKPSDAGFVPVDRR